MKQSQTNPPQPLATKRRRTHTSHQGVNNYDVGISAEVQEVGDHLHITPSQQPVWASTRQSLCDALPYFKAHQGGVYTKDCFPKGILFARNGEIGDIVMMRKCIYSLSVSRSFTPCFKTNHMMYKSGGGREKKEDGTWTRSGVYEPSHFEQWSATKDKQLPVVVIMGGFYFHILFEPNPDLALTWIP